MTDHFCKVTRTKIWNSSQESAWSFAQITLNHFSCKFLFQDRLFLRKSWYRYFLSDQPCTVPLKIKNHSKKKPLNEKYQQCLFLQITTKLLQIRSAFLIKNCDRLLLQITTKFWQIAIGTAKSYSIIALGITNYDRTHGNI